MTTENEDIRIGIYICHCGGNISDVVDVEKVAREVSKLPNVITAKNYMFMCSDPGQKLIENDIKELKLNRIVVAACSPSLHESTFRNTLVRAGLNPYLFEHANIREQVSWCTKSDPEGATKKAIALIAAAAKKVELARELEPVKIPTKRNVLVIGGGVAGLRAARDLSRRGFKVTIMENFAFLGGRAAQLGRMYPTNEHARESIHILLDEILENINITYYTLGEIVDFSGYVGNFKLRIKLKPRGVKRVLTEEEFRKAVEVCPKKASCLFEYELTERKAIFVPYPDCYPPIPAIDFDSCDKCGKCVEVVGKDAIDLDDKPKEVEVNVGAIILALGFDSYAPKKGEYGYGLYPEVITLPQLIRLLDEKGPTAGKIEINGRELKRICFIHCVGSRQIQGIHEPGPDGRINDYCSRVCCTATLNTINEIHERFPHIKIFDFYQDIRTYGRGHEDIYELACKNGTKFFRWKGEEPPVVERNKEDDGFPLVVKVKDVLTFGEEIEVPTDCVVLSVGMVSKAVKCKLAEMLKLPKSADGFLQEVHPKLRPVELSTLGLFIAGACQGPMDISEACASASAAASKASALLAKGYTELDPYVAKVDLDKCTGGEGCNSVCVDECKFLHAINIKEIEINGKKMKKAEVTAALCTGCGMCTAVCPYKAVQVEGWRLDQYEAMVDAILNAANGE